MSAFCGVVTSGECTHRHLTERPDAWWQGLGRRCLHFTWGQRGAISLEGLGLEVTTDPQQAEFVLAHGTEALGRSTDGSAAEPCSLDSMRALLEQCAPRRLPLVVANPDVVTVAGSELRWEGQALTVRSICSGGCLAPPMHCSGKIEPQYESKRKLNVLESVSFLCSFPGPCLARWHGTTARWAGRWC